MHDLQHAHHTPRGRQCGRPLAAVQPPRNCPSGQATARPMARRHWAEPVGTPVGGDQLPMRPQGRDDAAGQRAHGGHRAQAEQPLQLLMQDPGARQLVARAAIVRVLDDGVWARTRWHGPRAARCGSTPDLRRSASPETARSPTPRAARRSTRCRRRSASADRSAPTARTSPGPASSRAAWSVRPPTWRAGRASPRWRRAAAPGARRRRRLARRAAGGRAGGSASPRSRGRASCTVSTTKRPEARPTPRLRDVPWLKWLGAISMTWSAAARDQVQGAVGGSRVDDDQLACGRVGLRRRWPRSAPAGSPRRCASARRWRPRASRGGHRRGVGGADDGLA